MWYVLVKQSLLNTIQYQDLQKRASLTEVELFNEPYENWCVFSVEKEAYPALVDFLDREGIVYELSPNRPTRTEMLNDMR